MNAIKLVHFQSTGSSRYFNKGIAVDIFEVIGVLGGIVFFLAVMRLPLMAFGLLIFGMTQ